MQYSGPTVGINILAASLVVAPKYRTQRVSDGQFDWFVKALLRDEMLKLITLFDEIVNTKEPTSIYNNSSNEHTVFPMATQGDLSPVRGTIGLIGTS